MFLSDSLISMTWTKMMAADLMYSVEVVSGGWYGTVLMAGQCGARSAINRYGLYLVRTIGPLASVSNRVGGRADTQFVADN